MRDKRGKRREEGKTGVAIFLIYGIN